MADYNGIEAAWILSENSRGFTPYGDNPRNASSPVRMTTNIKRGGAASLKLLTGQYKAVWVGCNAGTQTISVWVYPNPNGKSSLHILDPDTAANIGIAFSVADSAWEQLSVTFTAEKKVYVAKLANHAIADGDTRAYFDDILVE